MLALVTSGFLCHAAEVEELPLERAWRAAQAGRATDDGWEPPGGWPAALARRRRRLVLTVVCTAVVALVLSLGLRGLGRGDWGDAVFWLLVLGAPVVRLALPLVPGSRRSRWEADVREQVRDEHARAAAAVPDSGRPNQP